MPDRSAIGRQRYERSAIHDLIRALGAVEFGDRIVLFGASLLLSVLPLIILLSALASSRVDDDIAEHLGLDRQGSRIIEGLFSSTNVSFNLGVFVALILAFAGTIAVARSVQVIYERSFGQVPARGAWNLLRCFVWVAVLAGWLVADETISGPVRHGPAGPELLGVVEFVALTLLFSWSTHFLLAGKESWKRVFPSAILTAIFWVGLGVFASFYFSSTVVSDSRLYGTIGVVFTLVTWFIAIGAVITLGAVAGVVLQMRRSHTRSEAE